MTSKILFVSKDASWQRYRNEVLIELTKRFDCEVDIITQCKIKPDIKSTDKLRYIKSMNLLNNIAGLSFFPKTYYYILKEKPFAVLALPNSSNITELTLAIFCKFTSSKLVYWTHGYDHCQRPKSGIKKYLEKIRVAVINWCVSQGDSIITFSNSGKTYLTSKGIDDAKIFVAPNTLNTEKLLASYDTVKPSSIDAFKAQYDLCNKTVYLFSGRLRAGKRLEHFIQALSMSSKKSQSALVVVGDGDMSGEWQKLSREYELNIHFLGEIFDEEKLAIIFKSADWFIMPGYVGLAIVHAFSAGLPLLTENISFHSPEINYLEENINGVMFNEFAINEWVTFIDGDGENEATKLRMSTEALRTVRNEASIQNQLTAMALALDISPNV
ncbi:glycosyltransferase family 4 protein [Shewanella sp. BF02_Schw]|jgi:glycosyltransferase involved in cell wall biosynthesis|uniref:glycosyltransferase family 4 protein n=1 Tax=Shewanella sp. BF02_Schw TaxID=394908 RepID=UPI00177ACF92|nr:glycosyltransferase family 4 protein [Shewanella sp. BF02_Schw]MBO1894943.1 glycosyltransferase family 4 protein [Shewanella sp. BF02_Schw]|tara:strand:+ start:5025 stop:6176 length:1152 start_codon:yes stop_codon:yes gene_type:complete